MSKILISTSATPAALKSAQSKIASAQAEIKKLESLIAKQNAIITKAQSVVDADAKAKKSVANKAAKAAIASKKATFRVDKMDNSGVKRVSSKEYASFKEARAALARMYRAKMFEVDKTKKEVLLARRAQPPKTDKPLASTQWTKAGREYNALFSA